MSKVLHSSAAQPPAPLNTNGARPFKSLRRTLAIVMVFGLVLIPSLAPLAQRVKESDSPITVTGVGARSTSGGTVVTVSADAPMNRTQTWQEGDKFHLVVPYAAGRSLKNLPRGVKVNRVSNSLEIVVNLKSGSSVTVDPRFNNLNLIVNGGINQTQNDASDETPSQQPAARTQERAATSNDYAEPSSSRSMRERSVPSETTMTLPFVSSRSTMASSKSVTTAGVQEQASSTNPSQQQTQQSSSATAAPVANASPATAQQPANASNQLVPAQDDSLASTTNNPAAAPPTESQSQITQSSPSLFSTIFSTTGVAIFISMGLLALVYLRLRPNSAEKKESGALVKASDTEKSDDEEIVALEISAAEPPVAKSEEKPRERRRLLRRMSDKLAAAQAQSASAAAQLPEQGLEVRSSPVMAASAGPAALFGAYRVDQEVGKLILGQPHRMDVLASRAPDDRRAMESSLLKALNAAETDDDGRRRARQAFEEYGFLARHSAALLLAHQACDRASAARMLGQIGAPAALPFLLEALYDTEMIVRTQVVSSIGALRLPSAIGALLDMARRHPEMPSGPLSQALSACSLDCFDIGGVFEPERPSLFDEAGEFDGEIARLEPSVAYEQLPEFLEDETLSEALERLENTDVEVRAAAARRLAQFQTQTSVAALTAIAMRDTEAAVRAAAVSSLGEIDHESVFAPVLLAFADEAREVQAAAARALSRLNFNRADAYVRIIETADEESLVNIARACIKARMAAQAIERLVSEDRRQAYEAFSLLSLLAKAGETEPLFDAIREHSDPNVQMAAIRLLGMTGRPEVAQQFRQLAVRDGLPEKVRTSLLEVVYKIDQAMPV